MSPANHRAQTSDPLLSEETHLSSTGQLETENKPETTSSPTNDDTSVPPKTHIHSPPYTTSHDSPETKTFASRTLSAHQDKGPLGEPSAPHLAEGLRQYVKTLEIIFPGKFLGIQPTEQTTNPNLTPHSHNLDTSEYD